MYVLFFHREALHYFTATSFFDVTPEQFQIDICIDISLKNKRCNQVTINYAIPNPKVPVRIGVGLIRKQHICCLSC